MPATKTCKYSRVHSESNLTGCPECSRDHWRQMFDDAAGEVERLRAAIRCTIEDNLDLADGENCTLIKLKRAINYDD